MVRSSRWEVAVGAAPLPPTRGLCRRPAGRLSRGMPLPGDPRRAARQRRVPPVHPADRTRYGLAPLGPRGGASGPFRGHLPLPEPFPRHRRGPSAGKHTRRWATPASLGPASVARVGNPVQSSSGAAFLFRAERFIAAPPREGWPKGARSVGLSHRAPRRGRRGRIPPGHHRFARPVGAFCGGGRHLSRGTPDAEPFGTRRSPAGSSPHAPRRHADGGGPEGDRPAGREDAGQPRGHHRGRGPRIPPRSARGHPTAALCPSALCRRPRRPDGPTPCAETSVGWPNVWAPCETSTSSSSTSGNRPSG